MSRDKLLDNLSQWQATSVHHRFRDSKPEAIFADGFVEDYKRKHNLIWRRILRLHGTIVSLETLDAFPFDYFYAPDDSEFWHQVVENFMDSVVMLLCGLITDSGKDCLTLNRLKNTLATEPIWINEEDQKEFRQALGSIRFGSTHGDIASRVKSIRNSTIGHSLIIDSKENVPQKKTGVSLCEIRILFDAIHKLFGTLSFGSTYVTLSGDYMPTTQWGKLTSSSLEGVLDAIAKASYFVNEPELHSDWWHEYRKHHSSEHLADMNRYRVKFGLPEA